MGLTLVVLALMHISIGKVVRTFSMLQTVEPLALIFIAIFPHVDTISFDLAVSPVTDIGVSLDALPDSKAVLGSLDPLTVVDLSIEPCVDSLTMGLVVHIVANILSSRDVELKPTAIPLIVAPLSLIEPARGIQENAVALAFAANDRSPIQHGSVPLHVVVCRQL